MRVGLVTADFVPNIGGVASHVAELGRALSQLGVEVHVITLPIQDQRTPVTQWEGMTVHRPALPRGKPLYSWLLSWWMKHAPTIRALDLLHVHGLRPLEATRGWPKPVLFTNHTSGFLLRVQKGEREQRRLLKRMRHLVHVLAPCEERARATRLTGYAGSVDFIPNGVDCDRFAPGDAALRQVWGIPQDHCVILLASRLASVKGVCDFAQAVRFLEGLPVRLVCAGEGPEKSVMQDILADNGMLHRTLFLGSVPNGHMPQVYRAADIVVLPSHMEATSITGLEAMATGLPLIGTRVGGIPYLIQHNRTGFLVAPGNPMQLGLAIRLLAKDAARRYAMGQAARQSAQTHFSWERIAKQTLAIYQQHMP